MARLAPFADLSLINQFAERFGLDPDEVYLKEFNTVMSLHCLWKEQDEYRRRFDTIKGMMSNTKTK